MTDRKAPPGGAGEALANAMTITAVPQELAPPLLEYPDTDGSPVFFDALQVQAIREVINKSKGVYTTLVYLAEPGGTTTVLILLERAGVVGSRVNMVRRGYGLRMKDALSTLPRWQDELLADGLEGKAVIPARLLEDAPRNVDEALARKAQQDVPLSNTQAGLR